LSQPGEAGSSLKSIRLVSIDSVRKDRGGKVNFSAGSPAKSPTQVMLRTVNRSEQF
jgi:hypothetical protein